MVTLSGDRTSDLRGRAKNLSSVPAETRAGVLFHPRNSGTSSSRMGSERGNRFPRPNEIELKRNKGGLVMKGLYSALAVLLLILSYALYNLSNGEDHSLSLAGSSSWEPPAKRKSDQIETSGLMTETRKRFHNRMEKRSNVTIIKYENDVEGTDTVSHQESATTALEAANKEKCAFRTYPPYRYYNLTAPLAELPTFLSEAEYIRGRLPFVINAHDVSATSAAAATTSTRKICIDTSEWDKIEPNHLPFSDGQNPSIVSLSSRNFHKEYIAPLTKLYGTDDGEGDDDSNGSLENMFLGLLLVGNAECNWKMSAEDIEAYHFSTHKEAQTHRAVVVLLNEQMQTVYQTTLLLEHDAPWGKIRPSPAKPLHNDGEGGGSGRPMRYERSMIHFGDPRFFFHNGQIHVLYRQGSKFGYSDQIQNPLHFEEIFTTTTTTRTTASTNITAYEGAINGNKKGFAAYLKASETFTVCCGRNIALISEEPSSLNNANERNSRERKNDGQKNTLKALTWIDPVTVVNVDTKQPVAAEVKGRRRLDVLAFGAASTFANDNDNIPNPVNKGGQRLRRRRRLRDNERSSHIHGTNGYMIPLHSTSELLGIGHFHRPEDRKTSKYAIHGHHYTHVLFTIGRRRRNTQGGDSNDNKPHTENDYQLKRISNEFVFKAVSPPPGSVEESDADIVQFASGLDLIGSDADGELLISYGINDCEGATFFLDMKDVQKLLSDVPDGMEVVDLMRKIEKTQRIVVD